MRSFIALLAALLTATALPQSPARPLPLALQTLSDEVGVMTTEERRVLAQSLLDVFDRTGIKIIVVIVLTTAPERIEDYGERLAQRWKRDGGLDIERTIVVVVSVSEREMQIMPGKALISVEEQISQPDTLAGVATLFRESRYFEGLMLVTARLSRLLPGARRRSS